MTIGGGGGGSSSASTGTTPWTQIASQLAGTLKTNLQNLASGSNLTSWIKSLTDSTAQATKSGMADIRSSFAGSGLGHSTDLMRNLSDFQTKQTIGLNQQISQVEQTNIADQLAALQEIISLASGSYKNTGSQSQWNVSALLGK